MDVAWCFCRLIGIIFHTFPMRHCFVIGQFVIKKNCHVFAVKIGHRDRIANKTSRVFRFIFISW